MFQNVMRVTRSPEKSWSVESGRIRASKQDFRLKDHAIAYARAMSWSKQLTLFIDDDSGTPVRQSRESLTYPIRLD